MAEKEPFKPEDIVFKGAILTFAKIHVAEARKRKDGKPPEPDAPKFWQNEILLDPTNLEHQKTIAHIKSESVRALNHRFSSPENPNPFSVEILEQVAKAERAPPNFHLCWGYGNYLPQFGKKIYAGYKDMFWLRMKRNEKDGRPTLAAVRNGVKVTVAQGDKDCPYGGCVVAGVTDIWSYFNESRGVNSTLRTLVYHGAGKAFGKGAIDQASEFAAIGDLGNGTPLADPFAGGAAPAGNAARDPFPIT